MLRLTLALCALLLLAACGGTSAPTGQAVAAALATAGATQLAAQPLDPGAPVPRSYLERWVFVVPRIAPRGGQFFVCDTARNCDAVFAYFDAMKGLAGPYLYRAPSGLVVVQLNSQLTPGEAQRFADAVAGLH